MTEKLLATVLVVLVLAVPATYRLATYLERRRWQRALRSRLQWAFDGKVPFEDFPYVLSDLARDGERMTKGCMAGDDSYLPTRVRSMKDLEAVSFLNDLPDLLQFGKQVSPKTVPFTQLKFVEDLDYHDGPLLTHFVGPNDDSWLYYWIEGGKRANRWLVCHVYPSDVALIKESNVDPKALRSVLLNAVERGAYIADVVGDLKSDNVRIFQAAYTTFVADPYLPVSAA